jgi:FemAB-related protein (PEP-CTERM system-associated)
MSNAWMRVPFDLREILIDHTVSSLSRYRLDEMYSVDCGSIGVSTCQVFQGPREDWDAFVATHPSSTAAHLYGWKRVIEKVYQHDCPYLVSRIQGEITGVLPLVEVRSLAFGRFLVSVPFLNAGGPIGTPSAVADLTNAALEMADARRAKALEFRCTEQLSTELECSHSKVSSSLALPGTSEALWSQLPSKVRSQIRRPQKEGVAVKFGRDQLDAFFDVFARNMRDLGSPTHSRLFFETIADEFGEAVWFACAYLGDVPVAAGCAIAWREEVEITWASSLRRYNALAPNMLLYWSVMERAATQGFGRFNFGRSTPGTGSHRFKLQWGAADAPLFWYRAGRGAPMPSEGGSLSIASRVWQHMPLSLTNWLGPRLRGGIPA